MDPLQFNIMRGIPRPSNALGVDVSSEVSTAPRNASLSMLT